MLLIVLNMCASWCSLLYFSFVLFLCLILFSARLVFCWLLRFVCCCLCIVCFVISYLSMGLVFVLRLVMFLGV